MVLLSLFFVAKFFVGFWLKWVVIFFPVYGEGIKPLPIGIKSYVKEQEPGNFFSCNCYVYIDKKVTVTFD